jgi:hypothetical protein
LEYEPDDALEGPVHSAVDGSVALEAVDRASIDMQIATANQYPRSVTESLREAESLACFDADTAATMFYALPRGGKKIEGPSVRLAEIMAYSWGNLRVDADIVAEDKTTVTAMGTCFDLQKNVAIRVRVKRRITDKNGKRFNDDMIGVTQNAAVSIALRNAVFKTIPASLVRRIYFKARRTSLGEGSVVDMRRRCWEAFAELEVTEAMIFTILKVGGWDDVGVEQLITLRGLKTAIDEGDTTVAQAFAPESSEGVSDAGDELRRAAGARGTGGNPRETSKTAPNGDPGATDDSGAPEPPNGPEGGPLDPQTDPGAPETAPESPGRAPESPEDGPGAVSGTVAPGTDDDGPGDPETDDEDDNPGGDVPTDKAELLLVIPKLEAACELKGGSRTRKRRRFAGDSELANCEPTELREYCSHLLALAE